MAVFPESVIIRNTGRKCVLERLKFQGSERNELAWFISQDTLEHFGNPTEPILFPLDPLPPCFHIHLFLADITGAEKPGDVSPSLPGEIKVSKGT